MPLTLFERVRKGYSRFYSERELETEQNWNILTPTLMAITAFLSRSYWLLNQRPGGPATYRHVPHSSIFFSNWSDLHLADFLSSPRLYNRSTPTFFLWASQITLIQPVHGQVYIRIFLDRMHLLFTLVHLTAWPGSVCYKSRKRKTLNSNLLNSV